jgi:AcrR family transcriptional regulator
LVQSCTEHGRPGNLVVVEAMRDRILDAAERLLGRLGYQKTTMDDIAAEAGVGRRTIYLHFVGKEEVALGTIDRIVERLAARLRGLAAAGLPWDERVRRMLLERVMFRFDSVRGYFHGIDEIFRSLRPAYMARRAIYFELEAKLFASVLIGGRDAGVFEIDDAVAAADTLLLATNSLLPSALSTRELGERGDVEARASRIANLLLNGLRGRDASAPASPTAPRSGRRRAIKS